ncbi:MAG: hypothetical protein ACREQ5_27465, partial [Candidatus Dormibacteria bacterium]
MRAGDTACAARATAGCRYRPQPAVAQAWGTNATTEAGTATVAARAARAGAGIATCGMPNGLETAAVAGALRDAGDRVAVDGGGASSSRDRGGGAGIAEIGGWRRGAPWTAGREKGAEPLS